MHNNTTSLNYILKLDLINKLRLKSISHCPDIENIVVQFSTKQFTNYSRLESFSAEKDLKNQIKSILFYKLAFGFNPKIQKQIEDSIIENNIKKPEFVYFINRVILRSRSDINKFIYCLFIENNFKDSISSLSEANMIHIKPSVDGKSLSIKLPVSFSVFNHLAQFCNFSLKNTNIKNLHFNVNFRVKNYKYLKGLNIQNIFPFRNLKN